tara:strand:+ start:3195 stop:3482 length:288 start_codon:yes stop_codon:yes gene_type:complete
MSRFTGSRLRACILFYKLTYPDAANRLLAIQQDYLKAYAAFQEGDLDSIISTSADGKSATYAVGANAEEIIDSLAQAVEYFENGGGTLGWTRATI